MIGDLKYVSQKLSPSLKRLPNPVTIILYFSHTQKSDNDVSHRSSSSSSYWNNLN